MTRVLVLMAARNGEAWIEAQVASILGQVDVEVQLVISDDASRDQTRERIAACWGDDPRVGLIEWQDPSGSAGANFLRMIKSVDCSEFQFVALSDQDDVWFADKLSAGIQALQRSGAAGYSAAVRAEWPDGREAVLTQCPRTRSADFLFEGAGQGCTYVMEQAFMLRVQGFLSSAQGALVHMHFHDWLLYLLSRSWNRTWVFDRRPCMIYRQHGGNEIGARGGSSGVLRRLEMIRRGWYAEQISLACDAYAAAGGADARVLRLIEKLRQGPARGWLASASLGLILLHRGRRRVFDRWVVAISAALRWI